MSTKHLIVGGGVAGTVAAETLREIDRSYKITILAEERYPLYNRCSLPPLLRRMMPRESVFLRTLESYSDAGIEVLWGRKAVKVDTDYRTVTTDEGEDFCFDRLLVATGGTPSRLMVPGAMHERVNYFQYLSEVEKLDTQMDDTANALILGGGFIAYELCDACLSRGLSVTWATRGPRFLRRYLDEEAGAVVDAIATKNGAQVVHEEEVSEVIPQDGFLLRVKMESGQYFETDLLACGVGLSMNVDFLRDTSVEIGKGVLVNEYLESSVPGIFAAGDVAETYYPRLGEYRILANWNKAIEQGKIAGKNMTGMKEKYYGVPVYVSGLFDSRIMLIGLPDPSAAGLRGIVSLDLKRHKYRKLYFMGRRLAGAVLIGDFRGWKELRNLVEAQEPVISPESFL
ncbi:MAG: NAD(P)/FAD-dependent oxidoreductase [Candidatus Binatia bacterium]